MSFPSIQIFKLTSRVPEENKPFVFPHSTKSCNHPNIKGPDFLSLSATITIKLHCLKTAAKCLHRNETWKQRSPSPTCRKQSMPQWGSFNNLYCTALQLDGLSAGCEEQQGLTYGAVTLYTNAVWLHWWWLCRRKSTSSSKKWQECAVVVT